MKIQLSMVFKLLLDFSQQFINCQIPGSFKDKEALIISVCFNKVIGFIGFGCFVFIEVYKKLGLLLLSFVNFIIKVNLIYYILYIQFI